MNKQLSESDFYNYKEQKDSFKRVYYFSLGLIVLFLACIFFKLVLFGFLLFALFVILIFYYSLKQRVCNGCQKSMVPVKSGRIPYIYYCKTCKIVIFLRYDLRLGLVN